MRLLGFSLLGIGFLWITLDVVSGFSNFQHMNWIWHSQNLPSGETIEKSAAVGVMRELSLALNTRHRIVVIPALLMLVGGLSLAFSPTPPKPPP